MSAASGAGEQQRQIDLSSLSVEQLSRLQKQMENDLNSMINHMGSLRMAYDRFNSSKKSVEQLKAEDEGEAMLVPLTESMFARGSLASGREVIVDIGTGYYVRKTIVGAVEFLNKKVTSIKTNLDRLGQIVEQKRQEMQMVSQVLQNKSQQQQQQQAQSA